MSRVPRYLILVAALLPGVGAGALAAQDSQFGISGLGTPGRFESVRSRATAGAFKLPRQMVPASRSGHGATNPRGNPAMLRRIPDPPGVGVFDVTLGPEDIAQPAGILVHVEFQGLSGKVTVDYERSSPYATSGSFLSRVMDGGAATNWSNMMWIAMGDGITLQVRGGNTPLKLVVKLK